MTINEADLKRNVADKDTWLRLIYMVIFAVAFYLGAGLLFAIALLQFLAKLFTGKILDGLVDFGASLAVYLNQIAQYLSYASQDKPFPFAPFPSHAKPQIVDSADKGA